MPLHPAIERLIRRAYQLGHGDLPHKNIEEIRSYYKNPLLPEQHAHFEDIEIKSEVICRIHRANQTNQKQPFVVYLRASAYVLGNIDNANYFCQQLAQYLQCTVVALEPRISPEYKFPIPIEDCVATINYLFEHHNKLNLDVKRAAIWGDSSGGNMASALCHYYQEQGYQPFARQVLIYPMVDYYRKDYHSRKLYGQGYLMDTLLSDVFVSHYISSQKDCENPLVSPLLASRFNKLPTTLLINAQYDPMYDEAQAYISCLTASKVKTCNVSIPGMIHGFLYYANKLPQARFAQETAANFLKECFI